MDCKLHLMNDRCIIATVPVIGQGHAAAFKTLMDKLIEDIDTNFSSEFFDPAKVISSIMKGDALRAKANPPVKSEMSSFLTGDPEQLQHEYSVVVHDYN